MTASCTALPIPASGFTIASTAATDSTMTIVRVVMIMAVLGLAAPMALAQSTNDVAAPPPLTEEDLARAVNSDTPRARPVQTRVTKGVVTEYGDESGVYLIEVDPTLGRQYYLNDSDGSGSPEQYRQNAEADTNIGKWKLGEW